MPSTVAKLEALEPALSTTAQALGAPDDLPGLDASKLIITHSVNLKELPPPENLVFGQTMTDHMLIVNYSPETGWTAPVIKPYAPLELDPACSVFHYTPALFEGMKAFLDPSGQPRLFRPDLNMHRMSTSADRVALPHFDANELLKMIKKLVHLEKRWIPRLEGYSLYIRPTMIGTRPVAASTHACLYVICSPTGPYFPTGYKPVSLWAEQDAVRSWPGGTGAYKLGINYAPCFKPQREAAKKGTNRFCGSWITEAGQMNFFVVFRREDGGLDAITPALDGTILPGVTRNSVLGLINSKSSPIMNYISAHALRAEERVVTLGEVREMADKGRLVEAFGVGTAAIICPIGRIGYQDRSGSGLVSDIEVPAYKSGLGPLASVLMESIVAIQEGRVEFDGWSVPCL
ncbi:amino-transferase class IV protein [Ceratobasidium sp. AG-Ba]|nr:amino-transferase class IV protein [Ceratobasidium sp. AG-Ba]